MKRSAPMKRTPFARKNKQVDNISTGPAQHHGANEVGGDAFGSAADFGAIKEIAYCRSTADFGPSQHQRKTTAENIPAKVEQSHSQHTPKAIEYIVKMAPTNTPISAQFRGGIPKSQPVRSEAYRRAVASLPCVMCGTSGHSQAAHGSAGKGMGIKACDSTIFPACAPRPGVTGCHALLDQGALFSKSVRHVLEPAWAADTQRKIHAMGKWPKGIPYPHQQE